MSVRFKEELRGLAEGSVAAFGCHDWLYCNW